MSRKKTRFNLVKMKTKTHSTWGGEHNESFTDCGVYLGLTRYESLRKKGMPTCKRCRVVIR